MAGHSKWANIKHRKERQDKKKGKLWSKCSRAIMAAVRQGGPDPDTNLTLRYAIDEAKYVNMPKDTIARAIERASGAAGGADFESITYEGYGPSGVAILVDTLTDNRNRTATDVRTIFTKLGGSIGNPNSVAYMFDTKGQILVGAKGVDEEAIMNAAIEAGAEDVQPPEGPPTDDEPTFWTITTSAGDFLAVETAIEEGGFELSEAEVAKIPQNFVELRGDDARKLMNLVDAFEDNDDVQKVYTNADIPDEELASLG